MSSDIERLPPPNDAKAFESLCLDLWRDIWGPHSGAQKNGRSGQPQAGVDVFGQAEGRWMGVQCKQKDAQLWSKVTVAELNAEVKAAKKFDPKLTRFILTTTGARDVKIQERARVLSGENRRNRLFSVEVWAWEDIWFELYRRPHLFQKIARIYWPMTTGLPPAAPSLADVVSKCRSYLEHIAPRCQQMPLMDLDPKGKDSPLTLDAVYTQLHTTQHEGDTGWNEGGIAFVQGERNKDSNPLSALDAIAQNRVVVLKGDPGAGKSTLVSYLSLCLAKHHLVPAEGWLAKLTEWPAGETPIPVTVTLREFARKAENLKAVPGPQCLLEHLAATYQPHALGDWRTGLEQALDLGHVIVFFDGLDEVPTDAARDHVQACVLGFAERFRHVRVVLTCRTLPFAAMLRREEEQRGQPREGLLRLSDLPGFTLAPFNDGQIQNFITAWYQAHVPVHFSASAAEERRESLATAMHRPELRRLAGNPMLLTDMALLHTHRGRLPDDRARLYKEVIDLLLLRWDGHRQDERLQNVLREAGRDDNELLRKLGEIAFIAHGRHRQGPAEAVGDIPRLELLDKLKDLHPDKSFDWAHRLVDTIQERAGLLIAHDTEAFRFPHRSFQEYLAALHLVKDKACWREKASLLDRSLYWREVFKWAAGRIAHVDDTADEKGLNLLRILCPEEIPADELGWCKAWLAGECLVEMGVRKIEDLVDEEGPGLVSRIRDRLQELVSQGRLGPPERAQAGLALGTLGDQRPGVGTRVLPGGRHVPDIAWCAPIGPGPFVMGSKAGESNYEDERPQFTCNVVRHPFRIATYPVTVAQYAAFVYAGAYTEHGEAWWTVDGWKWKKKGNITGPAAFEPAFQTRNHPQVGISWFEAIAFTNWLQASFNPEELGLPDSTWRVRLPTEPEWERAARHTDGRVYPWGSAVLDAQQHANVGETGIGHTSAVGAFPPGRSVCGALDLAGNAWEWCETQWRSDYSQYETKVQHGRMGSSARVVRGGSWNVLHDRARCSVRNRLDPGYRSRGIGFRVVASPFFSAL